MIVRLRCQKHTQPLCFNLIYLAILRPALAIVAGRRRHASTSLLRL